MVKEAITSLGGMSRVVSDGDTVLLKPNMVVPLGPETGVTTHPEIVTSVARLCKKAGASRVIVGDSPFFLFSIELGKEYM